MQSTRGRALVQTDSQTTLEKALQQGSNEVFTQKLNTNYIFEIFFNYP